MTFIKASEIASMDPVKITNSGGSDGPAATMIYDMVVYSDPTTGNIVPGTAESLTSVDAVVWTLRLRPNIKFSDGTAYDAAAVKFNYQRLQDPANAATRAGQANLIATMDVVDPITLRMTLKTKNAVFPSALTLIPFVGSPTAIQQEGSGFGGAPVGAGPFVLKSWQRDSQQIFVRNASYWQAPLPYLDQVTIKPIGDETQRINTFQTGQADMSYVTAAQNADQLRKAKAGVEYPMILNGGINIYFNMTKPPFNDIRARQGVALAIDFKDYAAVVNSGLQDPIDSIFRHDSPFYDPTIVQQSNNPAQAQALFDQLATDRGGPLTFTLTTFPAQNYSTTAQYVQGVLNKYRNVKVDVLVESNALHVTNCTGTNYPSACVYGSIFDDPEPTWTGLYTCDANPSPTGWCHKQFDADVATNRSTLDPAQRIAALKDAQKQFYKDVPSLYLERRYSWEFATPKVQNFHYANDGTPLFAQIWMKR